MRGPRVTRMPEGPVNGEKNRGQGLAFMQSPITTQINVAPVLQSPENSLVETYPRGSNGTANASSIYSGNLVFVSVNDERQLTDTGITGAIGRHSFGCMPKPLPGEEDLFCEDWRILGPSKNNFTNPEDGGAYGTGSARVNQLSVAVQVAGSRHLPIHCKEAVKTGDLLIWGPPDTNRTYEENNEFGNPIPEIKPLHWTAICDEKGHHLSHRMLELQFGTSESGNGLNLDENMQHSNYAKNRWHDACRVMKADKLTIGMAAILIGERKGHLRINTPQRTWEEAQGKALALNILALQKSTIGTAAISSGADVTDMRPYIQRVQQLVNNYVDEIKSGMERDPNNQSSSNPDNIYWTVDATSRKVVSYELGTRDLMDHLLYLNGEVRKSSPTQMIGDGIKSDDAIAYQIRRMGLGEQGITDELVMDTSEMLALSCYDALDSRSTRDFLYPIEKQLGGSMMRDENSKTFYAFESHLKNGTNRTAGHQMELRYNLAQRVVGKAFTPVSGTSETNFVKRPHANEQKIVDCVLGLSFI